MEIENCSNLSILCYILGDIEQALFRRLCHEEEFLTRKSCNCTGTAFVQGKAAGGSKLIEQTSVKKVPLFDQAWNVKQYVKIITIELT